ncbi:MAG: hypothetical protein J1F17_01105 [Oscillospiraceae bacterium]|nr:hypothetical protein [Oscillospiraceae bacterium]
MQQENKTAKKLRIAVIVMYVIQVFLLTESYFQYYPKGFEDPVHISCFYFIYKMIDSGQFDYAAYGVIMAIIPIAGFFMFCFDKKRNIKNIYAIFTSVIGVLMIAVFINFFIDFASLISLVLYIPIVFLSVMGIFARNLISQK